jgi:ataxia telangiectasia mutated family protein
VLVEIETLSKDLDVQGPAFPYDSVCIFLTHCLRVASQDVRLHRMQIEEKVLSWLLDNWGVGDGSTVKGSGGQSRMSPYMIGDILMLLDSICMFSKRINLVFRILLPDCPIIETITDQCKTKVIRDFLLNGLLPPFSHVPPKGEAVAHANVTGIPSSGSLPQVPLPSSDLSQPRGRERRISTYILKALDSFASVFESIQATNTHPTAEKARQALDLAIIALSFESTLMLNGTRSTRRVIQAACKLFHLVSTLLLDPRWSLEEKALILLGLEPLIAQDIEADDEGWEAILPPDTGAGIKTQTLKRLISNDGNGRVHARALRRSLQRIIMQNADVSTPRVVE